MNRERAARFERRTLVLRNEIAFVRRAERVRSFVRSLARSLVHSFVHSLARALRVIYPSSSLASRSAFWRWWGSVGGGNRRGGEGLFDHRHYWPPSCVLVSRRIGAAAIGWFRESPSVSVSLQLARVTDRSCAPPSVVSATLVSRSAVE